MIKFPLMYHAVANAPLESDGQLLVKIRQQNRGALEILYARYAVQGADLAFYILRDRVMAEEVTLEAFCQVWRLAFQFRTAQGTFSDWLYGIVHQLSIEALTLRKTPPFPRAIAPIEAGLTHALEAYSAAYKWLPITPRPASSAARPKRYLRNKSRSSSSPPFTPSHRRGD